MKKSIFDRLVTSIIQAGKIRRGELSPGWRFELVSKYPGKRIFRVVRLPTDSRRF